MRRLLRLVDALRPKILVRGSLEERYARVFGEVDLIELIRLLGAPRNVRITFQGGSSDSEANNIQAAEEHKRG